MIPRDYSKKYTLINQLSIECDSWATNSLSNSGNHDDEKLKILLKALLVVTKSTDSKVFSPTLTNFILQLLKLEKNMSDESRKLLMRFILVVGMNESTVYYF